MQSTKIELTINAERRMLGLAVPPSLLAFDDEVIELGCVAAIAHGRLWHFSAVPTALSNVGFRG